MEWGEGEGREECEGSTRLRRREKIRRGKKEKGGKWRFLLPGGKGEGEGGRV